MEKKKLNAKKIVSYIGSLLMVVSLVFVARSLINVWQSEDGISLAFSPWVLTGFIAIIIAEGLGILAAGLNFRSLLRNVSGVTVVRSLALKVYTESNMYKYIPGGVMYVAGRNRLAVEVDALPHSKVVLATVLEGILMVFGVVVVAIVFAFDHSVNYLRTLGVLPIVFAIVFVMVIATIPIVYLCRHKIGGVLKNLLSDMEKISFFVVIKRAGFGIFIMFLFSLALLLTIMLLGQEMTFELGFAIIGLYLIAWLAGFLIPGAPSGLGIREAVMLSFLSDFVDVGILIAAMVLHRVILVLGDLFAYAVAFAIRKVHVLKNVEV